MITALLSLVLAAQDPCAPVDPVASPDPQAATLYRRAGDAERIAGSRGTATVAYREAAALDPADAASRQALRSLCAEGGQSDAQDAFTEGQRRMSAGDLKVAAESFAVARRSGDRSAALLEGVCRYRLGEDAAAEAAFKDAEGAPEHQELAQFYLGLLALRAGRSAQAASLFDASAANQGLAAMAATLSRLAQRDGPLVIGFEARAGADTNVSLASHSGGTGSTGAGMMGGSSMGGSGAFMNGDGLYDLALSALWRPLGPSGPYLRGIGSVRRYLQQDGYDLAVGEAAAGWQWARAGHGLLGEYAFGDQRFGSSPYLLAHRLLGSGWVTTGDWTWSAVYFARLEDYAPAYQPFSGTLQRAEVKAAWTLLPQAWAALRYGFTHDAAHASVASYDEQGPRAELHAVFTPTFRAGLEAGLAWRQYAAFDSTLALKRADTTLDGTLLLEWDVGTAWTLRAALEGREVRSNAPSASYSKLVPTVGIAWTKGL